MKKTLLSLKIARYRIFGILVVMIAGLLLTGTKGQAQIYEPEGINMPGSWNTWSNPPTNLALASSTQVTGGRVAKIATGTPRYQTIFSVAATGGDLTGGSYDWLFTSGSSSNYYQNKWAAVTIVMNTLQLYTKEGSANNNITLVNGKWYTMNFEDLGYVNTRAIFMETSAAPVTITGVSVPASILPNVAANVNVVLSGAKCPEENIFLRYTIDAWATSIVLPVIVTGSSGSALIPGLPAGTVVSCYAFSTTLPTVVADYDLVTIKFNNNGGTNYSYTVSAAAPTITWANLQWPENGQIAPGEDFDVFGQAFISGVTGQPTPAPGLQAWVGYSTTNTDPSTWTNWIVAPYNAPSGSNDEFKANLGVAIVGVGTYYYATRFKLNADAFVYGGFSATSGGFWDGTTNVSGILTVSVIPPPVITWANLQWPQQGSITLGMAFDVFGQAFIAGVTGQPVPAPGLLAWVGYSSTNTNPSTWTNWIIAPYNAPVANNDEFKANLGAALGTVGTYYYATSFKLNADAIVYGGFSATGGGFWDGVTNVSGVLDVIVGIPEADKTVTTIYPNPTSGELNLGLTAPSILRLTDALGKVLLQKEIPAGRQQIDISGFNNGVYHLQIISGDKTMHQTIIKQ